MRGWGKPSRVCNTRSRGMYTIMEDDWRVPERDLKSCDSVMGLGAAPTSSSRITITGLARNGKPVLSLIVLKQGIECVPPPQALSILL